MTQKKRAHKVSRGTAIGAKKRPLSEGAKVLLGKGMLDDDSLAKRRKAFGL
jgi:hypothetical protein